MSEIPIFVSLISRDLRLRQKVSIKVTLVMPNDDPRATPSGTVLWPGVLITPSGCYIPHNLEYAEYIETTSLNLDHVELRS